MIIVFFPFLMKKCYNKALLITTERIRFPNQQYSVEELIAIFSAENSNYIDRIIIFIAISIFVSSTNIILPWSSPIIFYPFSKAIYFYYILASVSFVVFSLTNVENISNIRGLSIFIDGYRFLIKNFILCFVLATFFYFLTTNNKDIFILLFKGFLIPASVFGVATCVQINAFCCISIGVKDGVAQAIVLETFKDIVVEGREITDGDIFVNAVEGIYMERSIDYNPITVFVVSYNSAANRLPCATIENILGAVPLLKAKFLTSKVLPKAFLVDTIPQYALNPSTFFRNQENIR